MEESPSDGIQNFVTSDTTDISKHSPIDGLDSAQLSENQQLVVEISQTEEQNRINELDLTVVGYNGSFPYIINPRTFPKLVNGNRIITRRISWPCFKSEEIEAYSRNMKENEIQSAKEERNTNKIKGLQRNNSALTTKSIWGTQTSRFNNLLEKDGKFNRKSKYVPYMTALIPRIENKFKAIDSIKELSKEVIQYAVFKPINLVINSEELKGVVKNSQDKDDIVMVLKSRNNNQFTNYWLTRIIKCTNRQEYEVVDHSTGEYSLLKVTKEKKLFKAYQKLFDQPHPNMVEVLQLMTNSSNINGLIEEEKEVDEEKIYYILLNTHEYMTLDEYNINTIPSQINFKQIKEIIRGLVNGLVYLHSKSMALTKLTMKSVILSKNIKKLKDKEDFKVKIVDMDEVKELKGVEEVREDIKLIGNLLFNLIEGKKVENNHQFKSNLWNLEPKMYEFCIIALGKNAKFQSAVEALIHPWLTSKQ